MTKNPQKEETELLFSAPWTDSLPTEFMLFGPGMTETKKGPFLFDEEAGQSVMARFEEQGLDRLPVDVGHGMIKGGMPDNHRAFGWFVPAVRQDFESGELALWATDVQWTEPAAEMLQRREFRYFSPAITFNDETRRITGLINVALVNIPATKNQRPLVLDALEASTQQTQERDQKMQVLLDALDASDESGAVAKVGEFKAVLSALGIDDPKSAGEKIAQLQDDALQAQSEVARLTKEIAADKRAAAIDGLLSDGRLLDTQKDFAANLSDDDFEAFASTLVPHKAITAPIISEPDKVAALSAEEIEVCEKMGLSVEEFRDFKEGSK